MVLETYGKLSFGCQVGQPMLVIWQTSQEPLTVCGTIQRLLWTSAGAQDKVYATKKMKAVKSMKSCCAPDWWWLFVVAKLLCLITVAE